MYKFNRKATTRVGGTTSVVQPTQAMRLTCQQCHDRVKFQAEDDRCLGKLDRMDDDE